MLSQVIIAIVVVVTHDPSFAASVADSKIELDRGRRLGE